MYAYGRTPLEPKVVSEDSSSEHWRTVKVTYSAGYGNERIPAFLFLPLKATPPFQTVLFFPGAGALNQKSSENLLNMDRLGVLLKSGRAVLHPIYTGTYERRTGLRVGEHNREVVTQWTREISQSVDYLESRPDIDRQRLAYCGLSWGSRLASIFLALEPRFRVALLWSGGFSLAPRGPEIDEVNFAPRVRTPVLLLNG